MTTHLRRSIGLSLLTFYGLGNILGAGIYVLVGKVAGSAGMAAPLAFILASVVAGVTALTYAELSARLPVSAGEAVYLHHAFRRRFLSLSVGLMIALAGLVSAATISRGFVGYLKVFMIIPDSVAITVLIVLLGAVAVWGIRQSVMITAIMTLIEMAGLCLVIVAGADRLVDLPSNLPVIWPGSDALVWQGVLTGAFLAFYAYIGFEDMVNIAEEVRSPQQTLPRAILLALGISTLLYLLISAVAVLTVPTDDLAGSDAPLALIYQRLTGREPLLISQIALFAVVNGALIQIIMASRIFYGMGRQGWLPGSLAKLNDRTGTPVLSTLLATAIVLSMALWLPLVTLARITSGIVLIVFALVNAALLVIKHREPEPAGVHVYPFWLPVTGFILSCALGLYQLLI